MVARHLFFLKNCQMCHQNSFSLCLGKYFFFFFKYCRIKKYSAFLKYPSSDKLPAPKAFWKCSTIRNTIALLTHFLHHRFFSYILITLAQQNFAHMLRIVARVSTKSFEWIQQVLYVFSWCNDELERNSTLWLQRVKCCLFFNNRK